MSIGKLVSSIGKNVVRKLPKTKPLFPMEKTTAECLLWMGIFTGTPLMMAMCNPGRETKAVKSEDLIKKEDNKQENDSTTLNRLG